jgi:hypothetical protein
MLLVAVLIASLGVWGCGDDDDDGTAGTDADTDADSDADTDADTGTDSGNDCTGDGVWYDESSGLCWQDPPAADTLNWSAAVSYCDNLDLGGHSDWRLPNIEESISLVRGCWYGVATGDLSLSACSMTPPGCAATDSCNGKSDSCVFCSSESGPGEDGCYWDPTLSGTCSRYWSSSSWAFDTGYAWEMFFKYGSVYGHGGKTTTNSYARCVRGGPWD